MLNGPQLRAFPACKQWGRLNAGMHIPDALATWGYENSTPALGNPLPGPRHVSVLFDELFSPIPPEDAVCDQDLWHKIAAAADSIILTTRELFRTAHWYIAPWAATRCAAALIPEGLTCFEGMARADLYS